MSRAGRACPAPAAPARPGVGRGAGGGLRGRGDWWPRTWDNSAGSLARPPVHATSHGPSGLQHASRRLHAFRLRFRLPPELIAQHPAAERSASRLLDGTRRRCRSTASSATCPRCCARRPAGVQRHARDQGAPVRRKGHRRRGRGAGRARAAGPRRCWPTCARASRRRPARTHPLRRTRFDAEVLGRGGPGRRAVPPALPGRARSRCWSATATCRCRPTSRTPTTPTTSAATRPCSRARPARSPRRPPRCTSTRRCWPRCEARGVGTRQRHAARRRRHLPAGAQPRTWPSTACTASGSRCRQATVDGDRRARARGGRVVAVGTTTLRALESAAARRRAARRQRATPTSSSRPGFALPRRRPAGHQLPPAEQHAADAGQRLRRPRARAWRCTATRSSARYRFFSYGDAMLLARAAVERSSCSVAPTASRGAPRPPDAEPRRRRDADLHAGGHLRHRQGRDAAPSLEEMGAQIILGNTFHLWLRPGLDVMRRSAACTASRAGRRPILTDSGGFQVWSLGEMRKISEEGVKFASPVNGDKLFLTPEISMQIQTVLEQRHRHAVRRVHAVRDQGPPDHRGRGARVDGAQPALGAALPRRVPAPRATRNALFGIVQGGMFENLREESLAALVRARPARLRDRRRQRRRAEGRHAAHRGAHAAAAAGRTSRAT